MAQEDPLSQALTVAEDLRASVGDTIDSVLSQGAAQVRRVGPKMPAAPELPGGSSSSPELPEKFPELPEIGELPELPSLPEAPEGGRDFHHGIAEGNHEESQRSSRGILVRNRLPLLALDGLLDGVG